MQVKKQINKYTIVLDLDNCLIYSSYSILSEFNFVSKKGYFFLYHRPFLVELFLFLEQHFDIIFYTASKKEYAKWVVSTLPVKNKYPIFSRKYTRRKFNSCDFYLKSISFLPYEFNYESIFVLDDRPDYWLDEDLFFIGIDPWFGTKDDNGLCNVIKNLENLL